jgi:uncharacterized membrane protein
MRMTLLRRLLIGGAIAWAVALPAATFVAVQAQPGVLASLFAVSVYFVGSAVCHQLDARSFHVLGHQMPVCARCTGIYVGAAIAALAVGVRRGRSTLALNPRWLVGLALLPAAASLIYEWGTGVAPSNLTRGATGVVAGGTVAWLVIADLTRPDERTTL